MHVYYVDACISNPPPPPTHTKPTPIIKKKTNNNERTNERTGQAVYLWSADTGDIRHLLTLEGRDDYVTSLQWNETVCVCVFMYVYIYVCVFMCVYVCLCVCVWREGELILLKAKSILPILSNPLSKPTNKNNPINHQPTQQTNQQQQSPPPQQQHQHQQEQNGHVIAVGTNSATVRVYDTTTLSLVSHGCVCLFWDGWACVWIWHMAQETTRPRRNTIPYQHPTTPPKHPPPPHTHRRAR
jgi:hypothetical protein